MNMKNGMRPVHPGEILCAELDELGLSANALSKALGVPVNRVTMILNGQRGVSADTALRLARYFGTTPQLWDELAEGVGTPPSGDRGGPRNLGTRYSPAICSVTSAFRATGARRSASRTARP